MNVRTAALAALAVAAPLAQAGIVNAIVTADNHYAIFGTSAGSVLYVGGNELGPSGSPGSYNWSLPETWSFNSDDRIYIAAWSDDSVAQGLLADITIGATTRHSGDPAWVVYATGVNRGDGDPHPTAAAIGLDVAFADANALWQAPYVGGGNGVAPWGTVPGVTSAARWMWYNTPGDSDPLNGGSGAGEMLIFCTTVPSPGVMATLGAGLLCGVRRRR